MVPAPWRSAAPSRGLSERLKQLATSPASLKEGLQPRRRRSDPPASRRQGAAPCRELSVFPHGSSWGFFGDPRDFRRKPGASTTPSRTPFLQGCLLNFVFSLMLRASQTGGRTNLVPPETSRDVSGRLFSGCAASLAPTVDIHRGRCARSAHVISTWQDIRRRWRARQSSSMPGAPAQNRFDLTLGVTAPFVEHKLLNFKHKVLT
jgi:hypothetical protein